MTADLLFMDLNNKIIHSLSLRSNIIAMKKLNLYYFAEFFAVASVALPIILAGKIKVKTTVLMSVGLLVLCAVALAIQACKSATVVNKSNQTIKAKPEDSSCDPIDVKPGETVYGIDGIKVNGHVFKACDTTKIVVKKDGNVEVRSAIGKFLNKRHGGGWLDKCPEDDCWKPLFNS